MSHAALPLRLIVYVAVALFTLWPLPTCFTTALPIGCEGVATVPLLNAWTIWWNADQAAHGLTGYWDAPIFFPTRSAFVFSEAQPTTLLVAPLYWSTGNVVLAYNVYLLLSLTLNGWCAERLLRSAGLSHWAAFCGGVLTQLLPFLTWQIGVLQLTTLWGLLWTIRAAWLFAARPSWCRALELGLAYGVTYAACNYYGLFLAILLAPSGVWMLHRGWLNVRVWVQLLLAAAIAVTLVSPIVWQQRRAATEHKWQRDWMQIRSLSAHLRDYSDTPYRQWLDALEIEAAQRSDEWVLGPGWLKIVAAGLGLLCGLARPALRRWTLVAATMGLLALCYSLGPHVEVWNLSPYRFLFDYVPGFAQIRSPFRFSLFVQLSCVWLSAIAIDTALPGRWQHWLREWRRREESDATVGPSPRGWRTVLQTGASALPTLIIAGCLVAETLPIAADWNEHVRRVPGVHPLPPWVEFVRDELPPGAAIVCLPFVKGVDVGQYEETTWWMWWGMFHHRPLINGYSGFFPDSFVELRVELEEFPQKGPERLVQMGATHAVVQRRVYTQQFLARQEQTKRWQWLFGDERAMIDVYALPKATVEP